jgi:hypothetical protein
MERPDHVNAISLPKPVTTSQWNRKSHAGTNLLLELGWNLVVIGTEWSLGKNDARSQPVILVIQPPGFGFGFEKSVLFGQGSRRQFSESPKIKPSRVR